MKKIMMPYLLAYFFLFVSYFFCTKISYHYKRKGKNHLNEVFSEAIYYEQITN